MNNNVGICNSCKRAVEIGQTTVYDHVHNVEYHINCSNKAETSWGTIAGGHDNYGVKPYADKSTS